jgi:hypothetical protein
LDSTCYAALPAVRSGADVCTLNVQRIAYPPEGGQYQGLRDGPVNAARGFSVIPYDSLDPTLLCAVALQGEDITVRLGKYAWPKTTS